MTNAVNIAQIGSNNTTFRNKIINGAMVFDQRNAGASVTTAAAYTLDRYYFAEDTDGTMSVQQVSDAPEGFNNSIKFTVGTADASLAAAQYAYFRQGVEGYNFADLNFGTANAKTVTVSFWVKSSVTGLFSGNLASTGHDRCYGYSFTINSANTWEYKTATIPGDTTGTWNKTNSVGVWLHFCLASGSTYLQSAGAWAAGVYLGTTGSTNLMATSGNTFQVTGVQLEAGSTASPFEYRLYGTELQLCQRYFFKLLPGIANNPVANGSFYSTTSSLYSFYLPVTMRAAVTTASYSALADFGVAYAGALDAPTVITFAAKAAQNLRLDVTSPAKTAGGATQLQIVNTSGFLSFDAEL
jgi:hypothetical protein